MKWIMHDTKTFTATHNEYTIFVNPRVFWEISIGDVIVDRAWYHTPPPTMDELNAKVQAERCLNKLLNQ
jgi:hypothetical protein